MDGANEQTSPVQSTSFRSPPRYHTWVISSIATLIIAAMNELSMQLPTLIFGRSFASSGQGVEDCLKGVCAL